MRKAFRGLLAGVLFFPIMIGLGTLLPRPFFESGAQLTARASDPPAQTTRYTVLVLSSPIHTDLALPATPDVQARFGFMAADGLDPAQPGVDYVIAGWGGRSFYIETPTWSELRPGPLFKALTVDRSVMHMGLAGAIDPDHPSVMPIELDGPAFERLLAAVLASFTGMKAGNPAVIAGAQYGAFDLFYEAEGLFNATVGCNLWTARMLRQAGVKTGWWTPLPGLLTTSVALHNPAGQTAAGVPVYKPAER